MGYKICVINVATVDNTYFAVEFLEKVIQDKLWEKCSECQKKGFCHICRNRDLIKQNISKVNEFMEMHYVWLTEHGKRLTIRSITEQIAYMITGGVNCEEVTRMDAYMYLFCNLFFGYIGTSVDSKAGNIIAIREMQNCGYDNKRLRSDEVLLINQEYSSIFTNEIVEIIHTAKDKNSLVTGWGEFLRRVYFFTNIVIDEKVVAHDCEDIFSKQFKRYLELRNGQTTPSKLDVNLVCDALSMIYIGTTDNNSQIPLTLSRESGIAQNVQLITDMLNDRTIRIVQRASKDNLFCQNNRKLALKLEINRVELKTEITLPLLNYFEELRNGVISTNVDPQLSHGIESLKAELSELVDPLEEDVFEMIILKNSGPKRVGLVITDDKKIREM